MPDTTHECPGGDCKVRVPRSRLACPPCWRMLPDELKQDIRVSFKAKNWVAHRASVRRAMLWYREDT